MVATARHPPSHASLPAFSFQNLLSLQMAVPVFHLLGSNTSDSFLSYVGEDLVSLTCWQVQLTLTLKVYPDSSHFLATPALALWSRPPSPLSQMFEVAS